MDHLAQEGYDVYLVDLRFYGGSTHPPEMEEPASKNQPIVRTPVAVRDVGSAATFIRSRRGVDKISLIGWSWGTTLMSRYASENLARHSPKGKVRIAGALARTGNGRMV